MIFFANSLVKLASPLLRPGNTLDGFRTVSELTSWGAHVIILPIGSMRLVRVLTKFLVYMSIYGSVNAGKYYNKSGKQFSQDHPQIDGLVKQSPPQTCPEI